MEIINFLVEKALIIVPVLWIIGKIVKGTKKIADEFIPVILLVLGPILALALLGLTVEAFMQGVIAAGVAVFGHQLLKQSAKKTNKSL
jgi:hypothetical protein